MSILRSEIAAAISSDRPLSRSVVREWLRRAEDVYDLGLLHEITSEHWERIEPRLELEETCRLIRTFLVACIEQDVKDESVPTRYEAAQQLEVWFDHLSSMPEDTTAALRESAAAITDMFRRGDFGIRTAIETGFLEHVLEQPKLRPLFAHWATDNELSPVWIAALAWGKAHPNMMKRLRESRRDAQHRND